MVIRVGLDLVSVDDVAEALRGPHGQRYLARVYTEREIDDCRTATGIDPQRLAARFAAKEATIKALSVGAVGLPWRDIEVRGRTSGRVRLALHGRAAELAAEAGVMSLALAMTHDPAFAAAWVVAQDEVGSVGTPGGRSRGVARTQHE